MPLYRFILTLMLLSLIDVSAHAQTQIQRALSQINGLSSFDLNYKYSVNLIDLRNKSVVDTIVGNFYRRGREYVDSNNIHFAGLSGNYFCEVEFDTKKASIYNLEALQKRFHLLPATVSGKKMIVIDSFPLKQGTLHIDSNAHQQFYKVTWEVERLPYSHFELLLSKLDYSISRFVIESIDFEASKPTYKRIYAIYDISHQNNPSIFNLDRIFRVDNAKKIRLCRKYAAFELVSFN